MSEVLLPPWIIPEHESHEWIDDGSSVFRSAFAPGLAQRQSYGGLRLKLSRTHTVRAEEKAVLLSALKMTRGSFNAIRTRVHFPLRGTFPTSELLPNNTFENGTTGYESQSEYSISASDRIATCQRVSVTAVQQAIRNASLASVTTYAPYVGRAALLGGRGTFSNIYLQMGTVSGAGGFSSSQSGDMALRSLVAVPAASSLQLQVVDGAASGFIAGDYFRVPYLSLARCALVDNGENLLARSDDIDNTTAWGSVTSNGLSGVSANAATAPDGTVTADAIFENSSNSTHERMQSSTVSSAAGDYSLSVALRADGVRNWAWLRIYDVTGTASIGIAYFNLLAGTVGTVSTGVSGVNARAFIRPLGGPGNGWFLCTLVARKTTASTSVSARIGIATADNTDSYTGNGSANILVWRATLAQSSVPSRLAQTAASATAGANQQTGGIYIKGLPSSSTGLLLPGDWIEVNGELKQMSATLSSDASGLGFAQFEPPMVRHPSNNDPVVILNPMGKFLVSNIKIDNEFGIQARVSYDLEHIYE